jgi:hypothetical protein
MASQQKRRIMTLTITMRRALWGLMVCGLALPSCKSTQSSPDGANNGSATTKDTVQDGKPDGDEVECNWLFVLAAASGSYDGKTLTLENVPPALMFTDRPVRAFGHMELKQLIELVSTGDDNFEVDPPNAVLSTFGTKDKPTSGLVTLLRPKLEGNKVVFPVKYLEGDIPDRFEGASLFIDPFHMHHHGHGHWHPHIGRAIVGAAVVHSVVHASQPKTVVVTQPAYYYQAQPAPAPAPAASPKTSEQKLVELKGLFDQGLINQAEYDSKKTAILAAM